MKQLCIVLTKELKIVVIRKRVIEEVPIDTKGNVLINIIMKRQDIMVTRMICLLLYLLHAFIDALKKSIRRKCDFIFSALRFRL